MVRFFICSCLSSTSIWKIVCVSIIYGMFNILKNCSKNHWKLVLRILSHYWFSNLQHPTPIPTISATFLTCSLYLKSSESAPLKTRLCWDSSPTPCTVQLLIWSSGPVMRQWLQDLDSRMDGTPEVNSGLYGFWGECKAVSITVVLCSPCNFAGDGGMVQHCIAQ